MNPQDQPTLPELSPESIARIEDAVFAEITAKRPITQPSAARSRRRRWLTGLGIAAAFAAGILVAPPILDIVGSGTSMTASGGAMPESAADSATTSAQVDQAVAEDSGREIIQTANATLQVADIRDAADAIAALADTHGGYVETTEIRSAPVTDKTSVEAPPESEYGWIGIRVPSADLATVIEELAESGTVLSSSVAKQDVTSTAIDLRARVDATRASVERLTELMSNTGTLSELIEAEVALSERQAQLESYEQQLAALDDQVAMSSLQVELTRTATATTADPAGFGDGLLAGWNGLIVSLNALVIAFGFLLPWLAVAGVVVLVIWLVRRRRGKSPEA
ncbi:DUF4349 domain-containing protein [Microbacterium sp. A82]|uniref:DUF4349 domain-containing protein n=1 Tax=Microbacterium sp. A82 TaxID=3450452 RepID=UPI003F362BAE